MKFFVSIKKFLNSTIKIANKHHSRKKKGKKMKPKSNKIISWLIIFCFLNLIFSGVLFYKVKKQQKEIDTLIIVTVKMLYNDKSFQNNFKDSTVDGNLADSY